MQIHYRALELCYRHYTITHHLAAAHPRESDRLHTSNLIAPMADGRSETIEWRPMAILETRGCANDDLDDFLQLFPEYTQLPMTPQQLEARLSTLE